MEDGGIRASHPTSEFFLVLFLSAFLSVGSLVQLWQLLLPFQNLSPTTSRTSHFSGLSAAATSFLLMAANVGVATHACRCLNVRIDLLSAAEEEPPYVPQSDSDYFLAHVGDESIQVVRNFFFFHSPRPEDAIMLSFRDL